MKRILAAAAMALATATVAHASVIPVLSSVTASGPDYLFNYQADLAPDQGLKTGDQVAIVDFNGYVAGSVASTNSNWSASVSNTLPAGLIQLPGTTDSAAIPDLVFTYIGPNNFDTKNGPYPAQIDYLGLTALSTFSNTVLGSFSAVAVKNTGLSQGTVTYNVGSISVPTAVPEPAAWAMMLIGLGGIGMSMRTRRSIALAGIA